MTNLISAAIEGLCASDSSVRAGAAAEIYRAGRAPAEMAAAKWFEDAELAGLLLGDKRIVNVGLAVRRETFTRIRGAAGTPELAVVPPDQDAEEFELNFGGGVQLDVLTTKDPAKAGAIGRFLDKFGEGVQQVEFYCEDVERATAILGERFGVAAVYPAPRPGAGGATINFFLVPVPGAGKVLIELYGEAHSS